MPHCFSGSSIKFRGHAGWKINDLNPIWVRLLGRSQLSNPSDLPCLERAWRKVSAHFMLCGYSCFGSTRFQQHAMCGVTTGCQRGLIVACLKTLGATWPREGQHRHPRMPFKAKSFPIKRCGTYTRLGWHSYSALIQPIWERCVTISRSIGQRSRSRMLLAYLVHNYMSRSQLYLGFGQFGWLPSFFG